MFNYYMYILIFLALLVSLVGINIDRTPKYSKPPAQKPTAKVVPQPTSKVAIGDPNNILVVVNKKRPLPDGYAPTDLMGPLRSEAKKNLDSLISGANSSNVNLKIISGYRSQSSQATLYNSYVKRDGQAAADMYSARPGYSEHQTGLAIDLGNTNGSCDLEVCFENTTGGLWIKANVQNYGFIVRYPNGKTDITGYQYEPWHLRYVGIETAKAIYASGKTFEEYSGLPPAPNY